MNEDECCPKFDPVKWDKKTFNWNNKLFIKESIPTIYHIPFPPMIGKKIMKMWNLAQNAKANIPDKTDALILFRDPSAFRSEIYYSVSKTVGRVCTSLNRYLKCHQLSKIPNMVSNSFSHGRCPMDIFPFI